MKTAVFKNWRWCVTVVPVLFIAVVFGVLLLVRVMAQLIVDGSKAMENWASRVVMTPINNFVFQKKVKR